MPIAEFVSSMLGAFLTMNAAAPMVNNLNEQFAMNVDSGKSCFSRVSGTAGEYGSPEDYSLDLLCNYRLESFLVESTERKWRIVR